jgi:uncharacterized protein (TIGR03437 family)
MKVAYHLSLALLLSVAGLYAQAPAPNSVQNPASNILPGLPNFGIAQGSIFVVYGSAMGPSAIMVGTTLPLPTTLGGTSIQVNVAGTTVNALMVYTLQSQIAAVLPSNTPVGTGTLTVTYNGVSGSTPITVVQSDFGILTVNETGAGPGVITFGDYSLVTATNSAKPGDTLIIWGTGLGPITGSDAIVPTEVSLGTPITVYIGGVAASVVYHGRSADPGLDQINVVVPPGVSGCYVSVVVQTANLVSNTATTSVANGGGACSDANGLSLSGLAPILNSTGTVRLGVIDLFQESIQIAVAGITGGTTTTGFGSAVFEKYTAAQLTGNVSPFASPSINSCTVSVSVTKNSTSTPTQTPTVVATGLDAGAAISVTPPSGTVISLTNSLTTTKGDYFATFSSLAAGSYKISNGTGGADVGAFSTSLNVPAALTWTNQTSVEASAINRTQPLHLTWTGGDPNGYALIEGVSLTGTAATTTSAIFICVAPVGPGQFNIPPSVLLALPATSTQALISEGILLLGSSSSPQTFTAPGLDAGYLISGSYAGGSVTYQ